MRRGLPRTPGGEPWPPAGTVAATVRTSVPGPSPETASVVADTPIVGIPALVRSGAAALNHPVRRGLPRTTGGEPWPPAATVPILDQIVERSDDPAQAVNLSAAPAEESAVQAFSTEESNSAFGDAHSVMEEVALRRGLPRTANGEPWPPSTAVGQRTVRTSLAAAEESAPLAPANTLVESLAATPERVVESAPEKKRYGLFTLRQWIGAGVLGAIVLAVVVFIVVFATRWFLSLAFMRDFIITYPGSYPLPKSAPVGLPAWVGWQHFCNMFFMLLIIRSGIQIHNEKRPRAFWSPRWNSKRKISLTLWFHQSIDILWLANGLIFAVLLFATGQWMRIVPTSWDVFPNAISAGLQYASLHWPTDDSWANYNSLQQLTYGATVFLAAPLAAITGVRMSGVWPKNATTLNRVYPLELARKIHFPVMFYFVFFIVVHVTLVFATGALRNLNHMFAARDDVSWAGFWIFVVAVVVMAAGWVAARPIVLIPLARVFGTVRAR